MEAGNGIVLFRWKKRLFLQKMILLSQMCVFLLKKKNDYLTSSNFMKFSCFCEVIYAFCEKSHSPKKDMKICIQKLLLLSLVKNKIVLCVCVCWVSRIYCKFDCKFQKMINTTSCLSNLP